VITVQLGKYSHKLLSLHVLRGDDFSREEGENLEDETFQRQSFVRRHCACSISGPDGIWQRSISSFFESWCDSARSRDKSASHLAVDLADGVRVRGTLARFRRKRELRELFVMRGVHFHFRPPVMS
jgi:hypothetical protein